MHQQAIDWIARWATEDRLTAIDLGGRETNGHARWLWPHARWTVVDAAPGPGVEIVADAASWFPPAAVDVVLCVEVAEHTPVWQLIVRNAENMLKPDGLFVFTAAGPGREVHGVNHDDPLVPGWYRNIEPVELEAVMGTVFARHEIDVCGEDVRAVGWPT